MSVDDAAGRIPLVVSTEELVLSPPGTCGTFVQCGHLQLSAEGVLNNASAVHGIDVRLERLADPIHDGAPHAETGEPDVLDVRVAVIGSEGETLLDHDGEPLVAELDLVTVPDCSAVDGG